MIPGLFVCLFVCLMMVLEGKYSFSTSRAKALHGNCVFLCNFQCEDTFCKILLLLLVRVQGRSPDLWKQFQFLFWFAMQCQLYIISYKHTYLYTPEQSTLAGTFLRKQSTSIEDHLLNATSTNWHIWEKLINLTWHLFTGFIGEPTGQPQSFTEYTFIVNIYHFISWPSTVS